MYSISATSTRRLKRFQDLLARVRHFDTLTPEIQKKLAAVAIPRHYKAGQVIYVEGEPATSIYLIEKGWVKATRMSCQGREQAMLCLYAGEIFGDIAVLTESPYPGTVTALEDVDVWSIPAEDLLRLMSQHHDLTMAMTRRMGERVLYYIDLVEDMSLCGVEVRVARTLLRNARFREGKLVVPRQAWTTFDEMAVRLGTVRDVLSRALRVLEKEGMIKVRRQEIVLLEPEKLSKRGDS
ncbi:MAG: Crp/Fnr family transcriptional regulator [Chloroflexi bacterium]|nr:Crp/Fnr family transcriptional regulator [Chloroflexota bacterium]